MKRTLLAAAAALALMTQAPASADAASLDIPSGEYALDKTHGSIVFKVNHLGLSMYTARFNTFDLVVNLDAEDITKSTFTATIETASIDTDYPLADTKDFNTELQGAEWLAAGEHPQATFTATNIEPTGDDTAKITGDFTLRGVTKSVTLDAKLNGAFEKHPFMPVAVFGFSATGTIKRSDYGMTHLIPNVGDEVLLMIEAEMLQKP